MRAVGLLEVAHEVAVSREPFTSPSVPATGELVVGRLVDVSIFPLEGDAVAMTFVDVTEARAAEARLQRLVDHDSLTELWNRRRFRSELGSLLATGSPLLLAMLDLNGFKGVNDTLGHASGDELLRAIAGRLREGSPKHWMAARLGGDEFAVVSAPGNGDLERPNQFAARIASLIQQPTELNGVRIRPSTSIGVAKAPDDAHTVRELLSLADDALYEAKHERVQFVVTDPAHRKATGTKQHYFSSLDQGFEKGQFLAYLQPIVDLDDEQIVGAEALSRWALPGSGVLLPPEYLQVLLLSGHARRLTDFMITTSSTLTRGDRFVSVNIDSSDMYRKDFFGDLAELCGDNDAKQVWLEIAENDIPENAPKVVRDLVRSGMTVVIDDYGVAFSNLDRLAGLEAQVFKLDRALTRAAARSDRTFELAAGIVASARRLNTLVIAEGIDSPEELDAARRMGCTHGQGYAFGLPAPSQLVGDRYSDPAPMHWAEWPTADAIRRHEAAVVTTIGRHGIVLGP